MRYLFIVICTVLFFASCKDDDGDKKNSTPSKRTVIVYIAGENNLSSFVSPDINEMAEGAMTMPENTNLIIFADEADASRTPYMLRMRRGAQPDTIYKAETDFISSDPQKMYELLSWIMKEYPSESYGLTLWGHSNGWLFMNDSITYNSNGKPMKKAYGGDNGNNCASGSGKYWINIPTMARVLEKLPTKLDFIFADACLFMSTEVAYELRNATDYIIGSPAEIPGNGAPYHTVVPAMFDFSEQFYERIINEYQKAYQSGSGVPMAAVKTSEMEALANATRPIMAKLTEKEPDTEGLIYYYGGRARVMFDALSMVRKNIETEELTPWLEALQKAVVYKKSAKKWDTIGYVSFNDFIVTEENYGGLSMYVPLSIYSNNGYSYDEDIKKMQWYYAVGMNERE